MAALSSWYFMILIIGILYMPLASLLFGKWKDGGWIFAKTLGIMAGAYLLWVCNVLHALPFATWAAFVTLFIPAAVGGVIVFRRLKKKTLRLEADFKWILGEELFFGLMLGIWAYMIGFKPEAYGTEKFMDYAFLTAMMRSTYMPFEDMWFSGSPINYYYGGQYITAYLIKLTGVTAGQGYNLMRALITSLSAMMPFSLTAQLMHDRLAKAKSEGSVKRASVWSAVSGAVAAFACAFCGNFHYVIFGVLIPFFMKLSGSETDYSYWFPDSTRYIGYNPDTADKTIHEFPSYSSVLGDLHAHYINILFVVTVTAVVYAWARRKDEEVQLKDWKAYLKEILCPEILLIGFFTGIFRWTNFWDFPIYFVVCCAVIFFLNLRRYRGSAKNFWIVMIAQAAVIFLVGKIAALPFTALFDQISSEIGLCEYHTPLYQMLILWGLPAITSIAYLVKCILNYVRLRKDGKGTFQSDNKVAALFREISLPDLTAAVLSGCALGLILLPEVIYVKDIYSEGYSRANTMFKLTYQAFILFAVVMGYVMIRALVLRNCEKKQKSKDYFGVSGFGYRAAIAGLVLLALTGGFIFRSCKDWFGDITKSENHINTDASVFVSEYFPDDFEAVSWINTNISGQPVLLEANGDSYSDYQRISVSTGLPTVLGWYVHEWLWRNDTSLLDERAADIQTIYNSADIEEVRELIEKYDIEYIYVGNLEREKFPELNNLLIQALGETVYQNSIGTTYIVKVDR